MEPSQPKLHHHLFFGITALALLSTTLTLNTAVYAGSEDPKKLKTKPRVANLPAGVSSKKQPLGSVTMWLERGDTLYAQKKYPEAIELYQKAVKKGSHDAEEKLQNTLSELVIKGDELYLAQKLEEAFSWYTQSALYGSTEAKEKIADFGAEIGDAYAAKGNQAEALKCYEQAASYGSEEAREKLEKLNQSERVRLAPPSWLKQQDEAVYQRFLKGVLVYRPDPKSDVGKIELKIADLKIPMEGTFDLSQCGDTEEHVTIATGYRKSENADNGDKITIWITPRFLIEKNLSGDASHFKSIMSSWDAMCAPVGLFFNWDRFSLCQYDYANTENFDEFFKKDFYEKWSTKSVKIFSADAIPKNLWKKFRIIF